MSDLKSEIEKAWLRRVTVVIRSWDGPNSRVSLEMDLNQMPWGAFDALGKELSLLIPASPENQPGGPPTESQLARALKHVEHAADRCGEFALASNGNQESWLESQRTWEWIRRYLTRMWLEEEVRDDRTQPGQAEPTDPKEPSHGQEVREEAPGEIQEESAPTTDGVAEDPPIHLPSMPGAASTLKTAADALRAISLSVWDEMVKRDDPEAPTREEAIQTLLGVGRIMERGGAAEGTTAAHEEPTDSADAMPRAAGPEGREGPISHEESAREGSDPDQVSFDFAEGYDQGYQMGRKVGWTLGSRHRKGSG